jgi:hypothetical protein
MFYFKTVFIYNFYKMASVRVRFSPGFLRGAICSAKNRVFHVVSCEEIDLRKILLLGEIQS